jgi:hypothetical protein
LRFPELPVIRKNDVTRKNDAGAAFPAKAICVHGNTYDYSEFVYVDSKTKSKIICGDHAFWQTPNDHLTGRGCGKCRGKNISIAKILSKRRSFLARATAAHGDRYNYDLFKYLGSKVLGEIVCSKHGIFEQSPCNHVRGHGCPTCVYQVSKPEVLWLDSLKNGNILRQYSIKLTSGRTRKVDGYDPETNTVYQFHGDYYHGNPKRFDPESIQTKRKIPFGDLHNSTIRNDTLIRESGYHLIVMWEQEFKELQNVC